MSGKRGVQKGTRKKEKRARPNLPPTYDLGLDSVLRTGTTASPDRRLIGNNFSALAARKSAASPKPLPVPSVPLRPPAVPAAPAAPLPLHPCLHRLSPEQPGHPTADFLLTSCPAAGSQFVPTADSRRRLFPSVAVAGCAEMLVLRGAVSVLGCRATHRSGPLPFYSAPLGPFLSVLEPVYSLPSKSRASLEPPIEAALEEQLPARPPAGFCYAVIRLSSLPKSETRCLSMASKLPLPTTGLLDGPSIVPGLSIPYVETKFRPFQTWTAWPDVISSLERTPPTPVRVLTFGEHGSGKSMLARCTVNLLLHSFPEVLFVDTDIGQPELVPPGMVAATAVRRPLLGPPASHNTTAPLFASFVGETTPREQIGHYSAALSIVISSARRYAEVNSVPIVVNSDGWLSGAGADLHEMALRMAEPTHVFASSFSASDSGAVVSSSSASRAIASLQAAEFPSYRLVLLQAPYSGEGTAPVVPAPMMRELSLSCYLSNTSVRSVCLADVNVSFLGEGISGPLVLAALRSMTVAIAVTNASPASISWRVLGLGLVRAVDPDSFTLFVASPVSDLELELCDGLIVSRSVATPPRVIQECGEKDVPYHAPYVVQNILAGSNAMKSRATLHRH